MCVKKDVGSKELNWPKYHDVSKLLWDKIVGVNWCTKYTNHYRL